MTEKHEAAKAIDERLQEEGLVLTHPVIRFQTQWDYAEEVGEVNTEPSMTVPDMSMSINEIMLRYAQGRPLVKSNHLHYGGDTHYPDPRTMDITEVEEMRERNAHKIKELEELRDKEIEEHKAKRKEKRDKLEKLMKDSLAVQLDLDDAIAEAKNQPKQQTADNKSVTK